MRWEGLGKWPQWVLSEWVSCQGPGVLLFGLAPGDSPSCGSWSPWGFTTDVYSFGSTGGVPWSLGLLTGEWSRDNAWEG